MFKNLVVHDGIVHKGKTYQFNAGETAIVGPNGSGKSLLVEYLAFALFGSCALRGKVSDYKNLSVTLTVQIKNQVYVINRNTKDCTITRLNEDAAYCYGTKPCNLEVIKLLGYDYNVYKMANYAEQLDILGLGKLKPSERKAALDKTLGIGVIDKMIKHAKEKATEYKQRAEAIESTLTNPGEEPVRPEGYREPSEIAKEYEELRELRKAYDAFQDKVKPEEPMAPDDRPELEKYTASEVIDKNSHKISIEATLRQLRETSVPDLNDDQVFQLRTAWCNYHAYEEYLKQLEFLKGEEPSYTKEELGKIKLAKESWVVYERDLRAYETGQVTCPHCKGVFNPYNEKPVPPTEDKYENIDYKEIERQRELNRLKEMRAAVPVVAKAEKPEISESTVSKAHYQQIEWEMAQRKILELEKELEALSDINNDFVTEVINYQEAKSIYKVKKTTYDKDLAEYEAEKVRFNNFDPAEKDIEISHLWYLYQGCTDYLNKKKTWDTVNNIYQTNLAKVNEERINQEKYQKAQESLLDMKVKIKGYVLPSLQKVSSILLSDMSDGLFQKVEIDPDFNILVEGREINLFSGSEQAMINLALRLGLGQVLTHKTFSVFIGDEIDASMSNERAQLTADCLRKVSKYIKQTILISHRDIEAEHYINLSGGNNEI